MQTSQSFIDQLEAAESPAVIGTKISFSLAKVFRRQKTLRLHSKINLHGEWVTGDPDKTPIEIGILKVTS